VWDSSGDHSLSQLWMRDAPPRPLDFCSLAALADVFFPRVWLRRARQVPAGHGVDYRVLPCRPGGPGRHR
jgi:hypothetical protein